MPEHEAEGRALVAGQLPPTSIQNRPADAVATKVLIMASAAEPFASSAEPALKPNQPTHSRPVPTHGERQRVRHDPLVLDSRGACRG